MAKKKKSKALIQKNLPLNVELPTNVRYFNTVEAYIDVFGERAYKVIGCTNLDTELQGAKGNGKSVIIAGWLILQMEMDDFFNFVMLMKTYSGAVDKGVKTLRSVINLIRAKGYSFPYPYDVSNYTFYRMKYKEREENQHVVFAGHDDYSRLTNLKISGKGYYGAIWHEEPIEMGDIKEIDPDDYWSLQMAIKDNVIRTLIDDFKVIYPGERDHVEFRTYTSANPWVWHHPVVERMEKYHPVRDFVNWCLGFDYMGMVDRNEALVGKVDVIPEVKQYLDDHWEDIQLSLTTNRDQMVDVLQGKHKEYVYKRFWRGTKFALPTLYLKGREARLEELFGSVKMALLSGSKTTLTTVLGLAGDGSGNYDRLHDPENLVLEDTIELLQEFKVKGLSFGWDHDYGRGPVLTPFLLLSKIEDGIEYYKFHTAPQVYINYGKSTKKDVDKKEKSKWQHEAMIISTKEQYDAYFDEEHTQETYIVFDDDDASYINYIEKHLEGMFDQIMFAKKHGEDVKNMSHYGYTVRDNLRNMLINSEFYSISKQNTDLVKYINSVPCERDGKGEKKRSIEGIYGKKLKDVSNSEEYAWWPFRIMILEAAEYVGGEHE